MTMIHPNELPDAPEWQVEPRDWDDKNCCPVTCAGICERTEDNIIRGTE